MIFYTLCIATFQMLKIQYVRIRVRVRTYVYTRLGGPLMGPGKISFDTTKIIWRRHSFEYGRATSPSLPWGHTS